MSQPPARCVVLAASVGVFVALLAIYDATLIRTVVDQDSGELVAAAHALGIAHPTGYPLWVLLGRGFDFLPVGGTSAYRVALLSGVSAAAACGLITALAAGLVGELLPAVLAGLALGLWFPTWSQAVRAEVYGLTALLVALALLALVRWDVRRSPRAFGWLALSFGFVAMHHRTAMLVVAPAFLAAAALTRPRRLRTYAAAVGLLIAPFLFYAYLPIRAAARPPLNWTDPRTFDRFLDHVLATQYQHFAFSHNLRQMMEQAAKLTPDFLLASTAAAVLLAVVGIPLIAWGWWSWLGRRPVAAGSLAAGAGLLCVWVLQWGETSDLKVFFPPLGEVLAISGALGMARLAGVFRGARVGRGASTAAGMLVCGLLLVGNWARSDVSDMWEHRDRWAAALTQMEPDAIFVSDFDVPSFATLYLQNVEGLRRDVRLLRTVRMPDGWYTALIEDREVRETAREAWAAASAVTLQLHDRTALFAYLLAQHFGGRRPVYCLHAPPSLRPPGPPHFVGLSEDLVALRLRPPEVSSEPAGEQAVAEYPGGVSLYRFELERRQAATGELVSFRSEWRAAQRLPGPMQFVVILDPQGAGRERSAEKRAKTGRYRQPFPLLAGRWELAPMPEGTMFEQEGVLIVPSNAPPGRCAVSVGLGPMYGTDQVGLTPVGEIEIVGRPLPSNPP